MAFTSIAGCPSIAMADQHLPAAAAAAAASSSNTTASSSSTYFPREASPESGSSRLQRKRASKPKVRTGCITCKQRRVKCDETRPACLRCSKAALVCQGYPAVRRSQPDRGSRLIAPAPRSDAAAAAASSASASASVADESALVPRTSLPLAVSMGRGATHAGSQQGRSFEYFRRRTAPDMSDLFAGDEFWEGSMLRMCESEPSIRDAAVALGMMHEMHAANPQLRAQSDSSDPTAALVLGQYNRAIEGVNARLSSSPYRATEVALVSCLLFLGIDILLARYNAATKHVQNGLRIVQEWRPVGVPSYDPAETPLTHVRDLATRFETDEEQLAAQFARLNFNVAFIGVDSRQRAVEQPMPPIFTTLLQARIQLSMSGELIVGFCRSVSASAEAVRPSPATISRQQQLADRLRDWKTAFDASVDSTLATSGPRGRSSKLIMRMHYVGMSNLIDGALPTIRSMTDDEQEGRFRVIISLAQEVFEDRESIPTLCYDVGINYPLFSAAVECKSMYVRKQAIHMLEAHPRREGIVDSLTAAAFARKLIELEEAGATGLVEARGMPPFARLQQAMRMQRNGVLELPPHFQPRASSTAAASTALGKEQEETADDQPITTVRHPYTAIFDRDRDT